MSIVLCSTKGDSVSAALEQLSHQPSVPSVTCSEKHSSKSVSLSTDRLSPNWQPALLAASSSLSPGLCTCSDKVGKVTCAGLVTLNPKVFPYVETGSEQDVNSIVGHAEQRGLPPVDVLTVVQRQLLQRECHSQDAAGGRPTHQVKQLPDGLASALLQLPQHANSGNALQAVGCQIS